MNIAVIIMTKKKLKGASDLEYYAMKFQSHMRVPHLHTDYSAGGKVIY